MILEPLRKRLDELDRLISQHEISPQELQDERAAVKLEIDNFVYPILTLPAEISAELFLWTLDDDQRPHSLTPPLSLLGVCREWRALALSVPALWDRVAEVEFQGITTWFSRAGSRPLSLNLIIGETTPHLRSLISRHASRLQSLDLLLSSDSLLDLADIQLFPLLHDLGLYSMDLDEIANPTNPIPVFSGAPLLHTLWLENLPPSTVMMPWSQLTKLTASGISLEECLGVLPLLTSLCEFYRFSGPEEPDPSDMEQLRPCSSNLSSLKISITDEEYDILQFLVLPNLRELELGSRFGAGSNALNAVVVPFLSRTATTLQKFTVGLSPKVPVHWLDIATRLTNLELIRPYRVLRNRSTTDVIRALNRRNTPGFLPKLESFALLEFGSDGVDEELLDALDSRCTDDESSTGQARLQSFRLVWPSLEFAERRQVTLPLVHVTELRALAARGMRIHIGTCNENNFY
ncbi:hypothetical protein C8R43DRAFT_1049929 [Mycena crocata]|nr:hypothetical protein C8R43DRAFT_1049929 [Mycena crocata]